MIHLTTKTLGLLFNSIFRIILLARHEKIFNTIMYSLIIVCIFTSTDWGHISTDGEIFRFDKFRFLGKFDMYYTYSLLLFAMLFLRKIMLDSGENIFGNNNFLKFIFLMYVIPVNILVYFSINFNGIVIDESGLWPFAKSFVFVTVVYYVQDIFLKNKSSKQLNNIWTFLEATILLRCWYSITKFYLGFGHYVSKVQGTRKHIRLGQENDFADFFLLLFIISFTRLVFIEKERMRYRVLHVLSLISSTYILIGASRRYLWGEFVTAAGMLLFFHYWFNKTNANKKIILTCLILLFVFSAIFVIGPDRLADNPMIGRFITILSLISPEFDSEYGYSAGHLDEIIDGWHNVKNHWLLGISPYGTSLMERDKTKGWQSAVFVHNAYLQVWLVYGLLGFVLFVYLYYKAVQLGYIVFFRLKNAAGIILITFMASQLVKNIVWPTAIMVINLTIMYIFLISLVLREKELEMSKETNIDNQNKLNLNSNLKKPICDSII